ncbi:MAG: sugar phosphate isomerase/epimerase family protein [Chloroflexota bacterium]
MGAARDGMTLGIFSKTFRRDGVEEVMAAVRASGVTTTAFNFTCAGFDDLPEEVPEAALAAIRGAAGRAGVRIDCVSGTFNMAHPDRGHREGGLRRFATAVRAAPLLGASQVNICTGTRDTGHMWHWHAGNDDPAAWRDMAGTVAAALELAEAAGVDLLVEPETGNVINSPQRASRLVDEMASPRLKIIVDVANMTEPGDEARIPDAIDATFDLLGPRFAMIHGKDRAADGTVVPAGRGVVPWERLLDRLDAADFRGPFIIHGVDEAGASESIAWFRGLGIGR